MRTLQRSLLASAVALGFAASGTAAAQFSNVYFFGDSLTDAGSYKPCCRPAPDSSRRIPARSGRTVFGATLRLRRYRRASQGGTDYAQGGARVTRLPGVPPIAPTGSRSADRDAGAAVPRRRRPADPNAIYSVSGGAQRHLLSAGPRAGGRWRRPRKCRPRVGLAAVQLAHAGRDAQRRRRALHPRLEPAGHRQDARRHRLRPGRDRSPRCRRSSTPRCIGTLDAAGVQTMRVNSFALLQRRSSRIPAAYGFANATDARRARTPVAPLHVRDASSRRTRRRRISSPTASHPTTAGHAAHRAGLCDRDHRVRSRWPRSPKRRSPSSRRISARSTTACGRASTRRAARASSRHGRPTTTATRTCRPDRPTAADT